MEPFSDAAWMKEMITLSNSCNIRGFFKGIHAYDTFGLFKFYFVFIIEKLIVFIVEFWIDTGAFQAQYGLQKVLLVCLSKQLLESCRMICSSYLSLQPHNILSIALFFPLLIINLIPSELNDLRVLLVAVLLNSVPGVGRATAEGSISVTAEDAASYGVVNADAAKEGKEYPNEVGEDGEHGGLSSSNFWTDLDLEGATIL